MTIVAIVSTPRSDGNSRILVDEIAAAARANGKDVKVFDLFSAEGIHGCNACMGCKTAHRCVVEDGLSEILDAIRGCEGLILSTPCYFGGPTGQLKLLIDRFYGFKDTDKINIEPGKKLSVVVSCGGGVEGAKEMQGRIIDVMKSLGFVNAGGLVYVKGNEAGSVRGVPEVLAQARGIGASF